jgi:CheY-like chemotaxis protein
VLVDMMMPIMDGAATIEPLMRMDPSVRIIAVSGSLAQAGIGRAVPHEAAALEPVPVRLGRVAGCRPLCSRQFRDRLKWGGGGFYPIGVGRRRW